MQAAAMSMQSRNESYADQVSAFTTKCGYYYMYHYFISPMKKLNGADVSDVAALRMRMLTRCFAL